MRPAFLFLAAALSACAAAPVAIAPVADGGSYDASHGIWTDGGLVTVHARVIEHNGNAGYCGYWTGEGLTGVSEIYSREVLSAAVIYAGGTRLHQGLAGLPRSDGPAGSACYVTASTWDPALAGARATVRFPTMEFERDNDEATYVLRFRQVGTP